jgi:hypothetical protein
MANGAKRRKLNRPQLRVVFDTNILYTGSASDLVRQEVASLVKESNIPDLDIQWYLPDVVRHERQYQMQKRALELLPAVAKVERLLGHNLAISEQMLVESVEKVVSQRQQELGLVSLALNYPQVDWHRLFLDSVYRKPPFQAGETEKGFRDRLVVECFLQLVADSPKTAKICRIVLVSGDRLLAETVKSRTVEITNASVLSTLEELKGFINTLSSQVDEAFLEALKPKADKLFFIPKDESTLYYKEQIRKVLSDKFAAELALLPQGATDRKNGRWLISPPNFVKKSVRRIQWTSRIEIETEASKAPLASSGLDLSTSLVASPVTGVSAQPYKGLTDFLAADPSSLGKLSDLVGSTSKIPEGILGPEYYQGYTTIAAIRNITTHKGVDSYEVFWSSDVTTRKELRRPSIDEIRHVAATWEQIT